MTAEHDATPEEPAVEWIRIEDWARRAGVSRDTVNRYVRQGRLPVRELSRATRLVPWPPPDGLGH